VNRLPIAVWLVPIIILIVAVFPMPYYGFYTFVRLAICLSCLGLAYWTVAKEPRLASWAVALAAIGILFNPIIPVFLAKPIWVWIDVGAAAIILAHLVFVRGFQRGPRETN
jgi:uncharacterized protein DUF6804